MAKKTAINEIEEDQTAETVHRIEDAPVPTVIHISDLIKGWAPRLREIEKQAELDFSFQDNAVTICDMRVPNALRYGILYHRSELDKGAHLALDNFEQRVHSFLAAR